MLTKAHEDLETKTNALDAELKKKVNIKVCEVFPQTISKINYDANLTKEESEAHIEEKF